MMELDADDIRKAASLERGRRIFAGEPVTGNGELPLQVELQFHKAASADPVLLNVARKLGGDLFATYEALGGRYDHGSR
jgi:hypothetical protein